MTVIDYFIACFKLETAIKWRYCAYLIHSHSQWYWTFGHTRCDTRTLSEPLLSYGLMRFSPYTLCRADNKYSALYRQTQTHTILGDLFNMAHEHIPILLCGILRFIIYCLAPRYIYVHSLFMHPFPICAIGAKTWTRRIYEKNASFPATMPALRFSRLPRAVPYRFPLPFKWKIIFWWIRCVCTLLPLIARIIIIACHNIKSIDCVNRCNRNWFSIGWNSRTSEAIKWRQPGFPNFSRFSRYQWSHCYRDRGISRTQLYRISKTILIFFESNQSEHLAPFIELRIFFPTRIKPQKIGVLPSIRLDWVSR